MHSFKEVKLVDVVAAIRECIETLATQDKLKALGMELKCEFKDVFALIPHLDELPTDGFCCIKLKDTSQSVKMRSYTTPRKYQEAWAILIKQHLDTGCIWPSNSAHASLAFLVPKSDTVVLPQWVNDYLYPEYQHCPWCLPPTTCWWHLSSLCQR